MSDEVGDGAGEDEEGQARDHPYRYSPAHHEAAGVEVVEVPVWCSRWIYRALRLRDSLPCFGQIHATYGKPLCSVTREKMVSKNLYLSSIVPQNFIPEEESLDVTPERPGEHHLHEEDDHLRVLDHLTEVLQDPLARGSEVQPDEEEHGRRRQLEGENG